VKIGIFGFNIGPIAEPGVMMKVLRCADRTGYESVWTGEHVVLIDPQEPPSPAAPETPMLDTVAALAFAAAHTEHVKLGSGIILLPQRNPVVLAKELAGIDVLSKGRLIFGVGVGYVRREFEAIGVPYEERGPRTTEHIEAIRALWTQDHPTFDGEFTSFHGIQSHPQPVQKPHPPIVIGGGSPAAFRRAVAQGDGWYGFALDPEATATALQSLKEAAEQVERPASLGPLEISITPPRPVDTATVEQYEALGVARLPLLLPTRRGGADGPDDVVAFLERTAEELNLRAIRT
jgi:probable F420-dependent oxidoreductase